MFPVAPAVNTQHDDAHAPVRVQDKVATHHSQDRARCSKARYERGVAQDEDRHHVCNRSGEASDEIKDRIPAVPQ